MGIGSARLHPNFGAEKLSNLLQIVFVSCLSKRQSRCREMLYPANFDAIGGQKQTLSALTAGILALRDLALARKQKAVADVTRH